MAASTIPPLQPIRGPYKPIVILHGGAGSITRDNLPQELYDQYHFYLLEYLKTTYNVLLNGARDCDICPPTRPAAANAVEAVCHAVTQFEDNPLFNCGRGAVFTSSGENELEASLMVTSIHPNPPNVLPGHTKRNAAVSMLKHTRHPILLAREVLAMADKGSGLGGKQTMHGHVSGAEIEEWGFKQRGLERKGKKWFWTKRRWEEHRRGLGKDDGEDGWLSKLREADEDEDDELDDYVEDFPSDIKLPTEHHTALPTTATSSKDPIPFDLPSQGTVGAVVMDSWGNLAVATSTGGLTNKKPGRIGDTPTVGAGFWAESWDEEVNVDVGLVQPSGQLEEDAGSKETSVLERLAKSVGQEIEYWAGDCLPGLSLPSPPPPSRSQHQPKSTYNSVNQLIEKQPLISPSLASIPTTNSSPTKHQRRALALSGTGNGDSFLRLVATKTTSSIAQYGPHPLQHAVSLTTGPNGTLQKSAGDRWGQTGEGEGGMIGVEVVGSHVGDGGKEDEMEVRARVVADFNCGGMWRAYFEEDGDGGMEAKVMVFREEY